MIAAHIVQDKGRGERVVRRSKKFAFLSSITLRKRLLIIHPKKIQNKYNAVK